MPRVLLLHWNKKEMAQKVGRLRRLGFETDKLSLIIPRALKSLGSSPPDAVVIDLSRLPSRGRDVALSMRSSKDTQRVPIVFVDGDPEKVSRVKSLLPDAFYASWENIGTVIRDAVAHPPPDPVVPRSRLQGYSGTPLPRKLGVKEGSLVCLMDAPQGFEATLGDLPDGARIQRGPRAAADVAVWFVRSRKNLEARTRKLAFLSGKGAFWIAWRKKASGETSDVSEDLVRKAGLAGGMVDFKVASIDRVWSGLRFTSRKAKDSLAETGPKGRRK